MNFSTKAAKIVSELKCFSATGARMQATGIVRCEVFAALEGDSEYGSVDVVLIQLLG